MSQVAELLKRKGVVVVGAIKKPRGVITRESAQRIRAKRFAANPNQSYEEK